MNITSIKQNANNKAFKHNDGRQSDSLKLISSPTKKVKSVSIAKRWLCNVSEGVKLTKGLKNGLNVATNANFTQYDLMVKLLKAETCDVIYFDCHLSPNQIGILKMLQVFSNTKLVHARLAMQFDREIS